MLRAYTYTIAFGRTRNSPRQLNFLRQANRTMPLTLQSDTHNSLQAAVATLLDLPIEEVPFFFERSEDADEWKKYFSFLKARGFEVLAFEPQYERTLGCPYIAIGRSERNEWAHCVLRKGGKLVYDPHPSGDGLTETLLLQVLCPLDPGRHVVKASTSDMEAANG